MVLETLHHSVVDRLASRGRQAHYRSDEQIYRRGDEGLSLLIIQEGHAEVSVTTSSGRKSILDVMREGNIVGDIACLDGGPRSADVTALDDVRALVVDRRDVLDVLRSDGDAALAVIVALCQKARNATEMVEVKTLQGGAKRLATCILRLVEENAQDSAAGGLAISQGWLGTYAGLTRENVNRQLKAWSTQGVVRFEKGELFVADRQSLESIASGDDGR